MKSTVAELRTPAHGLARESHDVVGIAVGIVVALLPDDAVLVECDGARLRCLRAYSCLVAPEPGDRVVVSCADPQQRYVLAILERVSAGETRLRFDGDLLVETTQNLRFCAGRDIAVEATQALQLDSRRITVATDEAELSAAAAALDCRDLQARFGALRLIGKTLETVVERIVQISKSSFRTIEAIDHLRTRHLDYAASASLRLHGKNALLTAERLSKIDAEQIHLG